MVCEIKRGSSTYKATLKVEDENNQEDYTTLHMRSQRRCLKDEK